VAKTKNMLISRGLRRIIQSKKQNGMKTNQWLGLLYIGIAVAFVIWRREIMFNFVNDFNFYLRWVLALGMVGLGIRRYLQGAGK
jgi:energy-converting hydrogenase Eha subunit G